MIRRASAEMVCGGVILAMCGGVWAADRKSEAVGRWNLTLEQGDQRLPSWLRVEEKDGKLVGRYVGTGGGVGDVQDVRFEDGKLEFRRGDERNEAKITGDDMVGEIIRKNGSKTRFTGKRFIPPPERAKRKVEWGEPITLFNGKDLEGWETFGGESHWKVEDGVLVNTAGGANIRTRQTFRDFKLHVEFNSPPHGNSGVYLRGRYEIQVADDSGDAPPSAHGCGALYSRIAPSKKVTKKPGEWQTYDITIIGQRLTLVFNGETVIDNAEIEGITGGALDSNEYAPGPIYLQGDHTGMKYRNIVLTPRKMPARSPGMNKEGQGEHGAGREHKK